MQKCHQRIRFGTSKSKNVLELCWSQFRWRKNLEWKRRPSKNWKLMQPIIEGSRSIVRITKVSKVVTTRHGHQTIIYQVERFITISSDTSEVITRRSSCVVIPVLGWWTRNCLLVEFETCRNGVYTRSQQQKKEHGILFLSIHVFGWIFGKVLFRTSVCSGIAFMLKARRNVDEVPWSSSLWFARILREVSEFVWAIWSLLGQAGSLARTVRRPAERRSKCSTILYFFVLVLSQWLLVAGPHAVHSNSSFKAPMVNH